MPAESGVQKVQVTRRGREAVVREGVAVEVVVILLVEVLVPQREARPHDDVGDHTDSTAAG